MRARLIRHKWQKVENTIDKRCVYCGLFKYWDDRLQRWMYRKWGHTMYNPTACVHPENSPKPIEH